MPDLPEIDVTVVKLNRRNKTVYGVVTEHKHDGTYWSFIVDWSTDQDGTWKVEYPARAWRDVVDPVSACPECDSEWHYFHAGYHYFHAGY